MIKNGLIMENSIKLASFALAFSLLSLPASAKVEEQIVKSFDVTTNPNFSLENINGEVDIEVWDQSEIQIEANLSASNQEEFDRMSIRFDEISNGVAVETKYEKSRSFGNYNQSGKVNYIVKLPADTRLKHVELVNGSLSVDGVTARMDLDVVNGSINVEGAQGDSKIQSVNGSVKVAYASFSTSLDSIELDSVNGSVKLTLPSDASAKVDVETMHGSIKNDFGLTVDKNTFIGKNLTGNIGNGDVDVSIETVNGSVKIYKQ